MPSTAFCLAASCFVYVTFDHEEIGSATTAGADSEIMPELLRILTPNSQALHQLSKRTLIVSCDAAHAVHPNYPEKHQENHKCAMVTSDCILKIDNSGQRNGNQRACFQKLCDKLAKYGIRFESRQHIQSASSGIPNH